MPPASRLMTRQGASLMVRPVAYRRFSEQLGDPQGFLVGVPGRASASKKTPTVPFDTCRAAPSSAALFHSATPLTEANCPRPEPGFYLTRVLDISE